MLPAFNSCETIDVIAVASRSLSRASEYAVEFMCDAIEGYQALLDRDDIEAIYMPLPTGLHDEWVLKAIEAGKHILVEKSLASGYESAARLIGLAREKKILVMENFLFTRHSQFAWVKRLIASGELGDIHLLRSTFGFPPLHRDNFRYDKSLGGGALLDTGTYVLNIARLLLGDDIEVIGSSLEYDSESRVDIYGDVMLKNRAGQVAQVSFGFDYFYQCNLELLGTNGKLVVDRIFTPPPGFSPSVHIEHQGTSDEHILDPDDHYVNMADAFSKTVITRSDYDFHWNSSIAQARIIDDVLRSTR